MTTKQIIRLLTIAAFLAIGVLFGAATCQGPRPNLPTPPSTPAPK